jgi:hypothetical protein
MRFEKAKSQPNTGSVIICNKKFSIITMGNKKSKSLGSDHKKLENKFKFNKLQSIGSPDAESDHSLNKVL